MKAETITGAIAALEHRRGYIKNVLADTFISNTTHIVLSLEVARIDAAIADLTATQQARPSEWQPMPPDKMLKLTKRSGNRGRSLNHYIVTRTTAAGMDLPDGYAVCQRRTNSPATSAQREDGTA